MSPSNSDETSSSSTMTREQFVGAIDQGTTSTRFLIFNTKGEIEASHQIEFTQHYPHPSWVEHDPQEILDTVMSCIQEAVKDFEGKGHSASDIKAVGLTNQRETTVVWDKKTGKPLHNAIVWSDARTVKIVERLKKKAGSEKVQPLCGLPISTYFAAVKLVWLLEHVQEVKECRARGDLCFGTIDSWVLYNLTGGVNGGLHITDASNASRTMLCDVRTLKYDDWLVNDFFEFSGINLPKVVSSSEVYGEIPAGPLKGIPIAGVLGDQSAALVGQQCFAPGEAKNTYGTGCFLLYNTGEKPVISNNGLLTTVGYQFGPNAKPVYALEGSIAVAGSAIKWVRDQVGLIDDAAQIGELASQVEDTGGVVFVTAFSGLFAPYWRDDARGTILGLTAYTNKKHLCRATIEATCFQTKAILDAMNADSGKPLTSLKVDGGMTNGDVCMQIQSDILGIDVERPQMRESTALGSAMAAGLAVGVWQSIDDLKEVNQKGKTTFSPQNDEKDRKKRFRLWERAVDKACGWMDEDEADEEDSGAAKL
ncbi:Glycerol kinase [Savitreella phatthalungensis]